VVVTCHANSTYTVHELDGFVHRVPYAGKKVKLFRKRIKFEELEDVDSKEESMDEASDDNTLSEVED
jgi:hypothetical protein